MSAPLFVVPPTGPLGWLWPQLVELEGPAPAGALDLRREPLDVRQLVQRAREVGAGGIELADSPRAACLRGLCLRAQLETDGPRLTVELVESPHRPYEQVVLEHGRPIDAGPAGFVELDGALVAAVRADAGAPPERRWYTARRASKVPSSWWGLLPAGELDAKAREAWHRLLAARAPSARLAALAQENLALAGIDVYAESLEREVGAIDPAPDAHTGALVIAVCGVDGAGKSSHLDAIEARLSARGLRVARLKIYRHGVFHRTVTDLNRACVGERDLHRWPLQRVAKLHDSLEYLEQAVRPAMADADVLLFDRYLPTHEALASARYGWDPWCTEALSGYPPADLTLFLDLPTRVALERLGARAARTVDENPLLMGLFAQALRERAAVEGWVTADSRQPFELNRDLLGAAVDKAVDGR
ncbi:hypothetical protein [Engelhardtia mirabilis]|uniref:Thymidylate kinase n=1 Tax=Engelhardtia mirabilis TaxID=2528011 RepID=A0A518BFG6_9BACT|nr:thymidylate kinase [Planctomycetes bacterium Pla133]QDU99978.1 thymidylate kinase [Planctomycetes bacterium Pla86]